MVCELQPETIRFIVDQDLVQLQGDEQGTSDIMRQAVSVACRLSTTMEQMHNNNVARRANEHSMSMDNYMGEDDVAATEEAALQPGKLEIYRK